MLYEIPGPARTEMKIAVDARCLNRSHLRGIGRLLTEIIERSPSQYKWFVFGDRNDQPFHTPKHDGLEISVVEERGFRFHVWEQVMLPVLAIRHSADILFYPANSAPLMSTLPSVVIIHDVIAWKGEFNGGRRSFYHNRVLPRAFSNASKVVTVSQTSASEIRQSWPKLKPEVIYNGVSELFLTRHFERSLTSAESAKPFILYIGGDIPRKRLRWAIDAWKPYADQVNLLTCGVHPESGISLIADLDHHMKEKVFFLDFKSERELVQLVYNARCIFIRACMKASVTVVEANACGTPILYSECGSLSELVGPTSQLLPTGDLDAWRAAIGAFIQAKKDPTVEALASDWARQFSWSVTAKAYQKIFESLLS